MSNLTRFFRNVLSAVIHELDDAPTTPFNGTLAIANYQDDKHEATVTYSIRPGKIGQVKFNGSWWNARCSRDVTLIPGQVVYIVDRRDNTLYVEPGFMLRAMLPMLTNVPKPSQESV